IFIPVVFMKGVMGRFFLQFGVTLCVAVALSYIEAITLAPARCAQLLQTSREHRSKVGLAVDRAFDKLASAYAWVLTRAMRYPAAVLVLAVGLAGGSAYAFYKLPGEFVPSQDQSRLMVRMTTAVGSDLRETDKIVKQAEAVVNNAPE